MCVQGVGLVRNSPDRGSGLYLSVWPDAHRVLPIIERQPGETIRRRIRNRVSFMLHFLQIPFDFQTGWFAAILLFLVAFAAMRTSLRRSGAGAITGKRLRRALVMPQVILLAITLFVAHDHGLRLWSLPVMRPAVLGGLSLVALMIITLVQWALWATRDDAARREMWVRRILPTRNEMPEWIALAGLAGVTEELAYRGLLFGIVASTSQNFWLGAVVSAIAFGAAHFPRAKRGMIGIGAIGLVLQALAWSTGSMIPAMIVHALANTLAGLRGPAQFKAVGRGATE